MPPTPVPPDAEAGPEAGPEAGAGAPASEGAGELVGVGVGPGDPGLITVAAVRALRAADVVIVPVSTVPGGDVGAKGSGRAESVVREHLGTDRVVRVPFVMSDRAGVTARRAEAWETAAQVVLDAFAEGATTVAFATLGDPNVYSTFTYLAATVRTRDPRVRVRTIPGITAMQDLAARSGTPLCEGREVLTLVPATAGPQTVEASLRRDGTVVVYKGSSGGAALMEVLARTGRLDTAVVGARLGMDGEQLAPAGDWVSGTATGTDAAAATGTDTGTDTAAARVLRLPYLSTVLVPADRRQRGGKL
jgi:precorrin-2/cobalt-factor-2 C20-methyltransferase